MESRLMGKKTMQEIVNAKDIDTIVSILFQGDYKSELEEFGGLEIKGELIDFALSKNLAKNVAKLVQISPSTEKKQMRAIAGKWNLYNIKIAIGAKDRGASFDSIARYLIDYGRYDSAFIRDLMREESIEGMLNKSMINSPYRNILAEALETYKKTKSAIDAVSDIDKYYYKELGGVILGLRTIDNSSARIIKMDIDMKNILLMLKAKRAGMKFTEISGSMVESGGMTMAELEQTYNGSKDVPSMAAQIKAYDLKAPAELFKSEKNPQMLTFEIGLRNSIFESSMKLLKHSILSFSAILAYAYMKEIEIFTLRILINSKLYGLGKEEASRLITWKSE